ncbi:hypothetical protein [Nocardia sp.]|uniref:hypothetical protein n=1 Tax=Nocardia sp. TaxID=1821 RepID=UPI00262534DA|nr:hypothetical protein [Nocardia sp.]
MTAADFDQMHAGTRDTVDDLIKNLILVGKRCSCGEPIDSQRHMTTIVGYLGSQYNAADLALLLAEALTRLALAQGAL